MTAVGLLTGARAVVRVEAPRPTTLLRLIPLPRESIGVAWSERAVWPAEIQVGAMERLGVVVMALVAAAVLLATLNAVILLMEAASARRSELAVRSAVGAPPRTLVGMLLGELRSLAAVALPLGLLAGAMAGALARLVWPGATEPAAWLASFDLAAALAVLAGLVAAAYLRAGLNAARPDRAAAVLRDGARTTADPLAIFGRKLLTAGHASVAGALLVAALAMAGATRSAADGGGGRATGDTFVIDAEAPAAEAWSSALARIAEIPGVEAESLSTPGALVGLGIRDLATAECGRCSRGGLPAPLWTVVADHHAVAPGFFGLAGIDVIDGRDFEELEPDAEPVAIVNETFARTAFERGQPIGKRVRVGAGLQSWYRVIGVVADARVPVLGADEVPRSVVYLDARVHAPRDGSVLVRGTDRAATAVAGVLEDRGFGVRARRTAAAHRVEATATLRWAERVSLVIALLALGTAAHGVYLAALQTTRRRSREIAVRRALGARTSRIVAYVLVERLRVVGWGLAGFVFLGTLLVGLLRSAAGLPVPGPAAYLAIAAGLGLVALAASARAAHEAVSVEPATLLH